MFSSRTITLWKPWHWCANVSFLLGWVREVIDFWLPVAFINIGGHGVYVSELTKPTYLQLNACRWISGLYHWVEKKSHRRMYTVWLHLHKAQNHVAVCVVYVCVCVFKDANVYTTIKLSKEIHNLREWLLILRGREGLKWVGTTIGDFEVMIMSLFKIGSVNQIV